MKPRTRLSPEQKQRVLALNEAGHSARAIGRTAGCGHTTVRTVLANEGALRVRMTGCEYPDYFDRIDMPEKAYWLGFIGADGCIITSPAHPEGMRLAVQLGIRDKGHLLKLKEALGAHTSVTTATHSAFGKILESANLSVSSPRLVRGLAAAGVTPRKSATLEPWNGPPDLMPHYWRGMVDGDGSLARKGGGVYTIFLCGTESCVRAFKAWATEISGTRAEPFRKPGITAACWYVSISGRHQVPKLVRALYAAAPASLDRKQAIADRILADEQPRRKPGPPSKYASEEEKTAARRASGRERQRRYLEKRHAAAPPS